MLNRLTNAEREHLARVKQLPCSVCDEPGPSEAHHINQGQQYTAVALSRAATPAPSLAGTARSGCGQSRRWMKSQR